MPGGIGGDSANALIWRSGVGDCVFKAVAMNAEAFPISTARKESRFTIAQLAATKCANGKSLL
jgi:hypothetical protein